MQRPFLYQVTFQVHLRSLILRLQLPHIVLLSGLRMFDGALLLRCAWRIALFFALPRAFPFKPEMIPSVLYHSPHPYHSVD